MMNLLRSIYHFLWAYVSAVVYGFPAKKLTVIGVTGTKGKSTTAEYVNAILEGAGYTTALAGTIRFKIGDENRPNKTKMTMLGRGFLQKFLREAVNKGCTHAVLELSSQGALLHRHRFIPLNTLIMTGVHKEHIEAHGSFERYVEAKFSLTAELLSSSVRPRAIIVYKDSPFSEKFIQIPVEESIPYSLSDADSIKETERGISFTYKGSDISLHAPGTFNVLNALSALKVAEHLNIPLSSASHSLNALKTVSGRVEFIDEGQPFTVVVDYAHTPDSLKALYEAFPNKHRICVLGNTGGGRDRWKRPEMARIAETYCKEVILTDEDPYNEDPREVVEEMKRGMKGDATIIMDRKKAISHALHIATAGDVVLITGKGTDPYIMRRNGVKEPWSDATVTRDLLKNLPTL